jgi:hypothetical protein
MGGSLLFALPDRHVLRCRFRRVSALRLSNSMSTGGELAISHFEVGQKLNITLVTPNAALPDAVLLV